MDVLQPKSTERKELRSTILRMDFTFMREAGFDTPYKKTPRSMLYYFVILNYLLSHLCVLWFT